MVFLYNISIAFYVLIIRVVSPFNKKASLWLKGRKDVFQKLENHFEYSAYPTVWFHVASLGEFEQARPVIEQLKLTQPQYQILLSFFSPSGYEICKNYKFADIIIYLPSDTKSNAKKFLKIVQPSVVFFVKYEFWYHYLNEIKRQEISLVLFSAIFRKSQLFFNRYSDFFRKLLFCFDYIFVQDTNSVKLLNSIGYDYVDRIGDTRFDRVKQLVDNKKDIPIASNFKNNKKLFIIGSAWEEDMNVLIPIINDSAYSDLKFIIAPHEINAKEINKWASLINRKSICFSKAEEWNVIENDVLFIDNIGMLSSLYQYAEWAWIGGSYGKGLHNILEAATYGMPVFFGNKNYQKFNEAKELIALDVAYPINDSSELNDKLKSVKIDEDKRLELVKKSQNYIISNTGATTEIMNYFKVLTKKPIYPEE